MTSTSGSASSSRERRAHLRDRARPLHGHLADLEPDRGQRRRALSTTSCSAATGPAADQADHGRQERQRRPCGRRRTGPRRRARARSCSIRASSSPSPTGRISRPCELERAALGPERRAWRAPRRGRPRRAASASASSTAVGSVTLSDMSASVSRSVRKHIPAPGRLSWTTCPSTHTADIRVDVLGDLRRRGDAPATAAQRVGARGPWPGGRSRATSLPAAGRSGRSADAVRRLRWAHDRKRVPARRAPRLLRRRRPGRDHRREGPGALRRPGLRAQADRAQQARRRRPWRRGARSSSTRPTRCPRAPRVVFSAHGVAPAVHEEAAPRAASRPSTRPARWSPRCTTRPCGSPTTDHDILLIGHERPRGGRGHRGRGPRAHPARRRPGRRRRASRCATRTRSCGSRRPRCRSTRRWRRCAGCASGSRTCRTRPATTSATPPRTARSRSRRWPPECDLVIVVGSRELVELGAPGRGRARGRRRRVPPGRLRRGDRPGLVRRRHDRRRHLAARRCPRSWCATCSDGWPQRGYDDVEEVRTAHRGPDVLPAARAAGRPQGGRPRRASRAALARRDALSRSPGQPAASRSALVRPRSVEVLERRDELGGQLR